MRKELIKTDKNGTKYYHCTDKCLKCGGTGIIRIYIPINGGECFDCGGSGICEWDEKEYTPEHKAKLEEQRKKRWEKKVEAEKAKAPKKNAEFFKKNGFNEEGKTYFVLGNTYDIKEKLKAQGAKWDNASRHWHMANKPEGREVVEISVDEIYDANYAGMYECCWKHFKENEKTYIDKIQAAEDEMKAQKSTSEYVGHVGDKIEIVVTYTHTSSWENNFPTNYWSTRVTHLHTFKDENGNVLTWKTGNHIKADYGTRFKLKGTIKDHSEYKGIKQTVLTRCKLEEVK